MSEDVEVDVTPADEVVPDEPVAPENRVPKRRLDQEIAKRRQSDEALAAAQARLEEIENRDASELERAQRESAKWQQMVAERDADLADRDAKMRKQERSALIRTAADSAGFLDTDIAVALANLDEIEDERDASGFVKKLLEKKPHLAKPKEQAKPELRKVFGADMDESSKSAPEPAPAESRQAFYDRIYGGTTRGPFDADNARQQGGGVSYDVPVVGETGST